MNNEKLLKKLYYDLKNPAAYAGKSKLLQEAGNHLIMAKEELLKKLYYDLKNPAAYAGKSKLLQEAKKHDLEYINRRCRRVVEIAVSIYS